MSMSTRIKPCKYCGEETHTSFKCFFRPREDSKPCKYCDSRSHLSWQCQQNPNKKQVSKKLSNGKQNKHWLYTRREWVNANPPDQAGYWYCYICGIYLTKDTLTVDHVQSRSRRPDLRNELTNLKPCCWRCNENKGSLSADEYLKQLNNKEG